MEPKPGGCFDHFARVQLKGLSREDLNGLVCVVLPPKDENEAQELEKLGRVKVSNYPKTLSLKSQNLVLAQEPDFSIPPLPFSVLEIARFDDKVSQFCHEARAAGEDRLTNLFEEISKVSDPEEFAQALFEIFGRGQIPIAEAWPADLESRILNTPGHNLYWLALEQVGHHLVLEACDGVFLGYQSRLKRRRDRSSEADDNPDAEDADRSRTYHSFGGILIEEGSSLTKRGGYTPAEWLSSDVDDLFAESSAHELWGSGKILRRDQVSEVLLLVDSIKAQSQALASKLVEQVAEKGFDVTQWAKQVLSNAEAEGDDGYGLVTNPSRPSTPRSSPGYAEGNEFWIFNKEGSKPQCDLSLSISLAFPFMRSFAELTGLYPSGHTFLRMLELREWKTLERASDGGKVGWTLRTIRLR
eukprot:TRINITY_DN20481_c0_g1_i3.p1 TRINITY_DN20481_c0_g1~~TRINITY_DN20481_c0_g1_i3.p1  ORF type:complete len:414 (-),score=66.57 TRINITY_DN20481_c0_g1_i3:27-1268(-)